MVPERRSPRPALWAGSRTLPRPARIVVHHTFAGVLGALVLALADLLVAGVSPAGTRVSPGEFALASAHLVACYLPVGLLCGVALGTVAVSLGEARWLGGLWLRVTRPSTWLERDPEAFGAGLAGVVSLALVALIGRGAYDYVSTAVHRDDLAAWAMGGVAAGGVVLAVILFSLTSSLLGRASRLLGPLATVGTLVVSIVIGAVAGYATYLAHNPEMRAAYGLPALWWAPLALLVYVLAAMGVGRWLPTPAPLRAGLAALALIAIAVVAFQISARTYGDRNRVRSVVEQRTVLGRRLVRAYAALTDRDGDRHTWAFGGGDCDDGDATVHPGARDVVGDGIDADCFAGDGAPDAEPHSEGHYAEVPGGVPERPNVLVITIDALRRDHLHANGYARETSPELDRFIESSVEFADVVPQSSRSLRSIPALWTGLYPSEIAFGPEYLWPALLEENDTTAELLSRAGYQTSVVMATDYFERVVGFFQGYDDVLQADEPDPPRDWAVSQALPRIRRLAATGAPFLSWVHLYNCHAPYLQDGVPSVFGPEPIDLYDTEIGLAGRQVQRLLDLLDELGIAERTIVVLASDHGEGFGEHGTFGHSTTLYQEEMVPLLAIRVPGVAPRHVNGLVGLLDVAPTIANLASVPLRGTISGRSLVTYLDGSVAPDPDRVVFAELMPDGLVPYDIKVARQGEHKLLWWVRDGTYQYFDLSADPLERNDLSDDRRDDARALLGTLQAWVARASRPTNRNSSFVEAHVRSRAWPVEHDLGIHYPGLFSVLGVDLPERAYHPGETLPLTFYYAVEGETARDLFFVVDLIGPPGQPLPAHFHAWHYPLHSRYHTDRWRAGEHIQDPTPIVIPEEVPTPIEIRVVLTVRDGAADIEGTRNGERARTFDVGRFRVEPSLEAAEGTP